MFLVTYYSLGQATQGSYLGLSQPYYFNLFKYGDFSYMSVPTFLKELKDFAFTVNENPENGIEKHHRINLTFSVPATSPQAAEKAVAEYKDYLEVTEMQASLAAHDEAKGGVLRINRVDPKDKFFKKALGFITRIVEGDAELLPYLNETLPADNYGDKMLVVQLVCYLYTDDVGKVLEFETKLMAAEKNTKTGEFVVTHIFP